MQRMINTTASDHVAVTFIHIKTTAIKEAMNQGIQTAIASGELSI